MNGGEKRILAIFDIDGTLLTNGMASRDSFEEAFHSVPGLGEIEFHPKFAGMTDRGIFREMLRSCGRENELDQLFPIWKESFLSTLRVQYPAHPAPALLPGVATLIPRLARHPNLHLALGTGNTRESARIKLERFGLAEFFPVGGFGGDHEERAEMVRAALAEGRNHYGDYDEAWVIGDTIHDVIAAHEAGAKVLLVETGPRSVSELDTVNPDRRLPDLSDHDAFFAALDLPSNTAGETPR